MWIDGCPYRKTNETMICDMCDGKEVNKECPA